MKTTLTRILLSTILLVLLHYPLFAQERIKEWLIYGPVQDEPSEIFATAYLPECEVMPAPMMETNGKKWLAAKTNESGVLDFLEVFDDRSLTTRVAYACSYIFAESDHVAALHFGSDDGAKIWINDLLVWEMDVYRGMVQYSETVRIPLKKGINRVLVKITQGTGDWRFVAGIEGEHIGAVSVRPADTPAHVPASGFNAVWLPVIDIAPAVKDALQFDLHVINNSGEIIPDMKFTLLNSAEHVAQFGGFSITPGHSVVTFTAALQEVLRLFQGAGYSVNAASETDEITCRLGERDVFVCLLGIALQKSEENIRKIAEEVVVAADVFGIEGIQDSIEPLMRAFVSDTEARIVAELEEVQRQIVRGGVDRSGEKIHVVGHAHIDMNWLWPWPETKIIMHDNLRQVAALMEEHDDFTMLQSQAVIYREIERTDPVLFEKIKKYVDEGRLEPVGGMWTEGDCNLSGGEALARSFLLGQRYFESRFGKTARVGWLPDNFGHPSQLPQILKSAGIDYYYFHRCRPHLGTFWWEGSDGSRVICYANYTYNGRIDKNLLNEVDELMPGTKRILAVTGVGDHGGGPTRADIDNVFTYSRIDKMPDIRFTTAQEYFEAAAKEMARRPEHRGEMQFIFEGCYTSNADIKQGNRNSENSLYRAEFLSTLQWLCGADYPEEQLRECWRKLTFNQFHDILPGSGIYESCKDAVADYNDIIRSADTVGELAFRDFTDGIKFQSGLGQPVVAFNVHPYARENLITAEIFSHEKPVTIETNFWSNYYSSEHITPVDVGQGFAPTVLVRDGKGAEYTGQIIWNKEFPPGYRTRVLFKADAIPAGGYKTFYIDPASPAGDNRLIDQNEFIFETAHYIVEFNKTTGDIKRVYDKSQKYDYLEPGKEIGLFVNLEKPHSGSAWIIGDYERTEIVSDIQEVRVVERGPVRACVQSIKKWGDSKILQRIYLYKSYPRIDFDLEIHWFERGSESTLSPFLQAVFPLNLRETRFTCHVPFDVIERPTDGQEVPAQFFVDVSDNERGIALLNSSKYGHALNGNILTLSLMRASYDPNIYPNIGMFRVHYALMPHQGDWREGVFREGQVFNRPVCAAEPPSLSNKSIAETRPEEDSFFSIDRENVILTGVKRAEDGDMLLLRICEIEGQETTAAVDVPVTIASVTRLNLLEKEIHSEEEIRVNDKRLYVTLKPHQIVTLGIRFLVADELYLEKVYRSKLDSTLQPYIVKLPQNYDQQKKYPLIVYLHGSGGDEKNIHRVPYFFPDEFFGLSVNGRGPLTDYCYDNAQDDIAEAIAEVEKEYSIDYDNIILAGTSMGGFGVYRTFFETPEKFKAVASFSGLPKGKIAGPEQPNFLESRYLKNFKNLYIFIFHQVDDPLCPYEMVEKSVGIFRENGAIVEFLPENTEGHGNPGPETIAAYHRWLRKVIKEKKHRNNWKYPKISPIR